MKEFFRIGTRWFNPNTIHVVEVTPAAIPTDQPTVKVHATTAHGVVALDVTGDDAEIVLKEIGYDKGVREKEAKAKVEETKAKK